MVAPRPVVSGRVKERFAREQRHVVPAHDPAEIIGAVGGEPLCVATVDDVPASARYVVDCGRRWHSLFFQNISQTLLFAFPH
jgi:hypothetical protein